jgi:hypothetical protein
LFQRLAELLVEVGMVGLEGGAIEAVADYRSEVVPIVKTKKR